MNTETPPGPRPSAVGDLLREAGVAPWAGKDGVGQREAARLCGVSRTTIGNWMAPLGGEPRNYDPATLDMVAAGLRISRRRLGLAAAVDMGLLEPGDGCPRCADLREGLAALLARGQA